MASYPDLGSTGQEYILEEQYKALFGYPNGNVNNSLAQEVPGTSRPFILQNQIYSQEIPITAPIDFGQTGTTSIGGVDATYQQSTSYPYLRKYYQVKLSNEYLSQDNGGALTWWFQAAGATSVRSKQLEYNILSRGVPNNLDPGGDYVPELSINGIPRIFGNGTYPWTYNVNSGIVLFTGSSPSGTSNITPKSDDNILFTFWRYDGDLGVQSGSTGETYWEATGTTGIQYGALSVETDPSGSIYTQNIQAKDTTSNVNLYTNLTTGAGETGSLTIGSTASTNTINGKTTFYNYVPECGVTAINDNELVNKGYVDNSFVSSKSTVPTVQFGDVTRTSANIYIPINYPAQTYNGAIPAPVPVIAGCIFQLTTDVTTDVTTILDTRITSTNGNSNGSAFNSYYVRPVSFFNTDQKYPGYTGPGSTGSYTGLQGIVLTNSTAINSSIKSVPITFSDGITRNAIYYNTNSITSLGTTGTISGQYYDYADYSVSTSKSFSWYINGVEPGTDGSSWLTGNSPTTSDIYLSYTPPNQIQDGKENVPGVNIIKFKGTFKTTGNTSAYGGPFTETGATVFGYTGTWQNQQLNNQFSNLYPESQYYFGLYSQNSATTTYSKNVYYPDNTTDYGFTGPTTAILQIYQTYSPSTRNINNYNGQIFATSFFTVTDKNIYKVETSS